MEYKSDRNKRKKLIVILYVTQYREYMLKHTRRGRARGLRMCRRGSCFSVSLLLTIVVLSMCFLPWSSISHKVTPPGHGWTPANSQTRTGWGACMASCGYSLVSFLFTGICYLYISSSSEDEVGLTSVLCASPCLINSKAPCFFAELQHILQLALLCSLPRKTAWISDQERSNSPPPPSLALLYVLNTPNEDGMTATLWGPPPPSLALLYVLQLH